MAGTLQGRTILVPETRDLDLFAGMLEAEGAVTLRCPLVGIVDLDDTSEVIAWIDRLVAGTFDDVVLLTGEGLRRLLTVADREGRRAAMVEALGRVRTVTRGPKPARALREIGLAPAKQAASPTSLGVLDTFAGENLQARRIGLQLYPGGGAEFLVAALRRHGAVVSPVTPYRYVSQAENAKVSDTIRALAKGEIDTIAFTSSPQVERLFEVARDSGLEKELAEGLSRTLVAAIGPVVEETLKARGITAAVRPSSPHLKPLVRAIAAGRSA